MTHEPFADPDSIDLSVHGPCCELFAHLQRQAIMYAERLALFISTSSAANDEIAVMLKAEHDEIQQALGSMRIRLAQFEQILATGKDPTAEVH